MNDGNYSNAPLNKKIVYVLLDGIGDLPHPSLNNTTPLEAASTPNMDNLAQNGAMGEVISVGKGIAPQSDIAVFHMLGYDFKNRKYVGRGVVESIGCNLDFREGDLALRGNFATVNNTQKIIDRRAGRIILKEEAKSLCDTLNKNIHFNDNDVSITIVPTIAHRVTIRLRHANKKLSANISNTDPAYDKIDGMGIAKTTSDIMFIDKSIPQDNSEESILTANLVNEFTQQIYSLINDNEVNNNRRSKGLSPINCILSRDAGNEFPDYQPINQKYGLSVASIVDMPVEIGISKILNMTAIKAGNVEDYEIKGMHAAKALNDYDVIYVHIKGPDEFGHDGDAIGKKKNIEEIDKRFFGSLLQNIPIENPTFVICGDHSTPCIKKSHSDDPIPLLISGNLVLKDKSMRYTEQFAKNGRLGTLMGVDVLKTAIDSINM